MTDNFRLDDLSLGKTTEYQSEYNADLLQAVPRTLSSDASDCVDKPQFEGSDLWHAYEMSWLNSKGKPVVAIGRFEFDATSTNIVESKSFKLYLNSFNQTRFDSHQDIETTLRDDLGLVSGKRVEVTLLAPDDIQSLKVSALPGDCLDDIDISIDDYKLSANLLSLKSDARQVSQTLHSHLLKSNCLITNQPDWASVVIEYSGLEIDKISLLRYLISFRMHNEFHEQCVERIYSDIDHHCNPSHLSVQALYTRRGGLDISPFRSSDKDIHAPIRRINRQ